MLTFSSLRDAVAGQMVHIRRTPKRPRAAGSNRSDGFTPPFTLLLASLCRFRRHFDHIYKSTA